MADCLCAHSSPLCSVHTCTCQGLVLVTRMAWDGRDDGIVGWAGVCYVTLVSMVMLEWECFKSPGWLLRMVFRDIVLMFWAGVGRDL